MIDTQKARDIARALRCTRSIALNYKKTKTVCPEWSESITDDAAEMIEALLADNERMSDLLMVMRIKMTGDCGVCRHQHVNVRDEPCASCIMTEGRDGWQYEGDEEHGEPQPGFPAKVHEPQPERIRQPAARPADGRM